MGKPKGQYSVGMDKNPLTNPPKGTKAEPADYATGKNAGATNDKKDGGAPGGFYGGAGRVIPGFDKFFKPNKRK